MHAHTGFQSGLSTFLLYAPGKKMMNFTSKTRVLVGCLSIQLYSRNRQKRGGLQVSVERSADDFISDIYIHAQQMRI